MADYQKVIAEVSFNYPADGEEFGEEARIIGINRFIDKGAGLIGFSFSLGRRTDGEDTMSLILPYAELMAKILELETEE